MFIEILLGPDTILSTLHVLVPLVLWGTTPILW